MLVNISDSIGDSFDLDDNQDKIISSIIKDVNKKLEKSRSDLDNFINEDCKHNIEELTYTEVLCEIYGIDINNLLDSYIDDVKKCENDFKDIFNDKLFPIFVLYRRPHTAVRVWTDLLIHHFNKGEI